MLRGETCVLLPPDLTVFPCVIRKVILMVLKYSCLLGLNCKGFTRITENPPNLIIYSMLYMNQIAVTRINLLKPTGHVMHRQFNIQQLYVLPTLYLCVLYYLRTNSELCHLLHKLFGFYNRDEKCLLRGANWVFK